MHSQIEKLFYMTYCYTNTQTHFWCYIFMTDVTVLMTKRAEYNLGFTHVMLFPVEITVSLYAEATVMKIFLYHTVRFVCNHYPVNFPRSYAMWLYKIYVV